MSTKDNYEPFGKAWEAELLKCSKKYLIKLIRRLAKENAELKSMTQPQGGET